MGDAGDGRAPASPTRDTEIDGFAVSEGEQVMVLLGAANVDEAEFPNAGDVDWDRDVNRHLAFGGGIHRCLGSHLARLELRVALREWHRRIPDYCIKPGAELMYSPGSERSRRSRCCSGVDCPTRRGTRPRTASPVHLVRCR